MLLSCETGQEQGKVRKWLGEGAKIVWGVSQRISAQKPKHVLHPLLTTFRTYFPYFCPVSQKGRISTLTTFLNWGPKNQRKLLLYKVFRQPLGSWTSAENHGRPRLKVRFPAGPGGWEKLFDPWASGRKGQERPREIRTKNFMFMLLFSSLINGGKPCLESKRFLTPLWLTPSNAMRCCTGLQLSIEGHHAPWARPTPGTQLWAGRA